MDQSKLSVHTCGSLLFFCPFLWVQFNLNIPRYVDTFEEEELVDIDEVQRNIADIEEELAKVQAQMKKYMDELGI